MPRPPPPADISDLQNSAAQPAPPELVPIVPLSTRRTRVPRWLRPTSGPLLLLALWQLLSGTGVLTPDILASPGTIARVGGNLVADGSLPNAMGVSLQRVAVGLLLGLSVGTWARPPLRLFRSAKTS